MTQIFCSGIAAILLLNQVALGQITYSITDLGAIGAPITIQQNTFRYNGAEALNNAGQVVGSFVTDAGGDTQGFLYDGVNVTELGTFASAGGTSSSAMGINNAGQVLGYATAPLFGGYAWIRPFIYANGTMTELGIPADEGSSSSYYPSAINDSGQVVGVDTYNAQAFLYSMTTDIETNLGTLGGQISSAEAINNSGQVVGYSWVHVANAQYYHGFLYSNGTMKDLGTLPLTSGNGLYVDSYANGVNSAGEVVGASFTTEPDVGYTNTGEHAFLYNGKMSDLGTLPAPYNYFSQALGINDSGQIVGDSSGSSGNGHAFIYSNGSMKDINSAISSNSGWTVNVAQAINANGQIAADAMNASGQEHAVLLTPHIVTTPYKAPPQSPFTTPPPPPTALGSLEVYDPKTGQFDYPASTSSSNPGYINPDQPTIVMTHGWREDSSTSSWDGGMATLIHSAIEMQSGGAGTPVNLVGWNWSALAGTTNTWAGLMASTAVVPNEGNALGSQLSGYLGTDYKLPMHYIGHSLGTMVNAAAINEFYALDHGETRVQDTVFDGAELANAANGIASAFLVQAPPSWAPVIPTAPVVSIDNYVSAVGLLYPKAINVVLTQGPTALNPVAFHSYPMQWYDNTIGSQADQSPMGFRYDITQPNGLSGQPVSGIDPYNFVQSPIGNQFNLSPILPSPPYSSFDIANGDYGNPAARLVGAGGATILRNVGALLVSDITGTIQASANAAINTFTIPPNSIDNSPTPELSTQVVITKQIGAISQSQTIRATSSLTATASETPPPTSSGYIWIPITIPANATTMSFDFTFDNLSPDDFLSVGVNDSLLFEIESQFLTNGIASNTGPLDVSQWAGEKITLFFGLIAADDNNAGGTITIDNVEYQSVPEPSATICGLFLACMLLVRRARVIKSSTI